MNTSPIALQPDLVQQVRRITRSKGATVEDFVNQAVRERLEQLEDQKLVAEVRAFERMHPQFIKEALVIVAFFIRYRNRCDLRRCHGRIAASCNLTLMIKVAVNSCMVGNEKQRNQLLVINTSQD